MSLHGRVALVTGASRGIGRGIILQLAEQGCTVIITGRTPEKSETDERIQSSLECTAKGNFLYCKVTGPSEIEKRGGTAVVKYCDHSDMQAVKRLFEEIENEFKGQLDILVNSAYSGVPYLAANMNKKFYESDPEFWDKINVVGLQNHYFCSVYAARLMARRGKGFIVNVSSFGGIFSLFNTPYGIGKAALDRMTRETAQELKNITVVSLYPGAVKTKMFTTKVIGDIEGHENIKDVMQSGESCDFVGKANAALASDEKVHQMTGRALMTVDLAKKYGFREKNGQMPPNLKSLKHLLTLGGSTELAKWTPEWIVVPGWLLWMSTSML